MAAVVHATGLQMHLNDGDAIRLMSSSLTFPQLFLVERPSVQNVQTACPHVPNPGLLTVVRLAVHSNTAQHLRILPNKNVDLQGGRGPWATFEVCCVGQDGVALRCMGQHDVPQFMSIRSLPDGAVQLISSTDPYHPNSRWLFRQPAESEGIPKDFDESITLSDADYEFFAREGYLIIRNAVSKRQVNSALRVVNHTLGKGPSAWVPDPEHKPGHDPEPPKMILPASNHQHITGLANTGAIRTISQRLLGRGNVKRVNGGQLAIRFPVTDVYEAEEEGHLHPKAAELSARDHNKTNWHIDGQGNQKAVPFSLLCKVALSNQIEEGNGNFTIFPRSHRNRFSIRWYQMVLGGGKELVRDMHGEKPDVGEPMQVCLNPGDCAFVHPYLAHRIGTNCSPNVRYSIIFRFTHADFDYDAAPQNAEALVENPMHFFPKCAHMRFEDDDPHPHL